MRTIKIIISPTMKMRENNQAFPHKQSPVLLEETKFLLDYLKILSYEELKGIWRCSDKLARMNYERIQQMDLHKNLTPAILAFQGLQYQYIAADVFTYKELAYLEKKLRILSGFYGVLKPLDGIVPYRLEMKAKFGNWKYDSVYDFWSDKIAKSLTSEKEVILNLASKEYKDSIIKYLDEKIRIVDCVFGEWIDGKVKQKATLAKMARGEMVRFMAENQVQDLEKIKEFNRLNYSYRKELSDSEKFIFIKE